MSSEIRCRICKGSKRSPTAHPSHKAPCGACSGTGFSTDSHDQPRNGTTRGLYQEDFDRAGIPQKPNMQYTADEICTALNARRAEPLPDLQAHSTGFVLTNDRGKRDAIGGILISWANPTYERRLEQDRLESASQGAQVEAPQA